MVDALSVKLAEAKAGTGRRSPETAPAPPASAKGGKQPAAPPPPEKPADGGELEVMAQLVEAKAAYKAAYEAWTRGRDAAMAAGAQVSALVGKMLAEFEVRAAPFVGRQLRRPPPPAHLHPRSHPPSTHTPAPAPAQHQTWYAANTGRLPPLLSPTQKHPALSPSGTLSPSFAASRGGFLGGEALDALDEGENFDRMEMDGVQTGEPDAGAFFQASRKLRGAVAVAPALNARPLVRGLSSTSPSKMHFTLAPSMSPLRK